MAKYMDVEQMLQDLKECNVDSVEVGLAVMQLTEYLRHAPGADVVTREQYESLLLEIAEANRKYAEDSLGVLQQIHYIYKEILRMISAILFIYIGVQIGAPWWYYTILGVHYFIKCVVASINIGKKVGEQSRD